jgi:hypothetical protein
MSNLSSRPRPYLRYCLIAVVLLGCFIAMKTFQEDNSATMAPYLVLRP